MELSGLRTVLGADPRLSRLLLASVMDYRGVEKVIRWDLSGLAFQGDIEFVRHAGVGDYFKKNFFSLCMLSVLNHLGLERRERVMHGQFMYYMRGIITCTDNMIDDEEKGTVFLRGIDERLTGNSLLMLTLSRKLSSLADRLDPSGRLADETLNRLHRIGQAEGVRDRSLYGDYPDEAFIRNKVHGGIGGELLRIGLLPLVMLHPGTRADAFADALFDLGMALQAFDDLCDMLEDFSCGKVNLATSFFMARKGIAEEDAVRIDIEQDSLTAEYVGQIRKLVESFIDRLKSQGYPVNQKIGMSIVETLFEARGKAGLFNVISYI